MNGTLIYLDLLKKVKNGGELSDLEKAFILQRKELTIISEVLVSESKLQITPELAVKEIRNRLNKCN